MTQQNLTLEKKWGKGIKVHLTCIQQALKVCSKKLTINGKYLKWLQFVCDILLISESTDESLKILNNLNKEGLNIDLIIIRNNTKVKFWIKIITLWYKELEDV